MAFNPNAVNYQQQISAFERGEARKNQAEKERMARQAEIDRKNAAKRSPFEKLLSAGARGAAAYFSGGLSETLGGGQLIDQAMLGEGAERNEFGDLVGLGSGIYQGAKAQQAAKIGEQDKIFNSIMERKQKNINEMTDGVQKASAQQSLDQWQQDYLKNRGDAETSGLDFIMDDKLGMNTDKYKSMIPTVSVEEQERKRQKLVAEMQAKLDKQRDEENARRLEGYGEAVRAMSPTNPGVDPITGQSYAGM